MHGGERLGSFRLLADRLRDGPERRVALVIGGGFCGLAVAHELSSAGHSVAIVDSREPGAAPASSAAAGILDALSPKGREMWRGAEAHAAAIQLLKRAGAAEERSVYTSAGTLHCPASSKQASSLAEAATAGSDALGLQYLPAPDAKVVAGGAALPHGALFCRCGVVVDSVAYLCALWGAVRALAPAEWVVQAVPARLVRPLASLFDVVVLATGAGCKLLDETRHCPVDLLRGQVLCYEGVPAAAPEPSEGACESEDGQAADVASMSWSEQGQTRQTGCDDAQGLRGDGEDGHGCTLTAATAPLAARATWSAALTGVVYAVPLDGRVICGATHEPTSDAAQREPPSVEAAETLLLPALRRHFPHLFPQDAPPPWPAHARAGVRALPPRSEAGSIPIAGRAHTDARNVWFVGGMGSHGLLYHALVARWLVAAALLGDATRIPAELRRGEFGALLSARLERVQAASADERRPELSAKGK